MNTYGKSCTADVYHVLFMCPLVSKERVSMWQKLDSMCEANEWERIDLVCQLAWYLLCPRSVEAARAIGSFLSTYLGACAIYDVIRTQVDNTLDTHYNKACMRWFGGRTDLATIIKDRIAQVIASRLNGALEFPVCEATCAWLSRHVREQLNSAFKPLREWLPNRWEMMIELGTGTRRIRSIALF